MLDIDARNLKPNSTAYVRTMEGDPGVALLQAFRGLQKSVQVLGFRV